MRTTPTRSRAAELAAASTSPANLHEPGQEAGPGTRLLLTVWPERRGSWRALAELPDGTTRGFDSPLELARFLAQWPEMRPAGAGGGLR
jgi:hypothetical protein